MNSNISYSFCIFAEVITPKENDFVYYEFAKMNSTMCIIIIGEEYY